MGNHCIAFNLNSSLRFLNLKIYCTIALRTSLSNIWCGEMVGEKKMMEQGCVCCCVLTCYVRRCARASWYEKSANLRK
jgi:hypothetical protein